jgi:hypothetical protein
MRTLFRKNGYDVFLVNEHNTSCKCSNCNGGECKKVMVRDNPKPYKHNSILVHSLLCCQNVNCEEWWDRDCNGAKNIHKIAFNAIKTKIYTAYKSQTSQEIICPNRHFKSSRV